MTAKKRCEACDEVDLYGQRNRHITVESLLYQLRADVVEQRCRYQWSQNQLAKRAQISRSTLGAFERGDTISFRNFVKITRALNMGAAWGAFHYYAQNNQEPAIVEHHPTIPTDSLQAGPGLVQPRRLGPAGAALDRSTYEPFGRTYEPMCLLC
jgi:transcriptional regulator with XRE-family HTH domain